MALTLESQKSRTLICRWGVGLMCVGWIAVACQPLAEPVRGQLLGGGWYEAPLEGEHRLGFSIQRGLDEVDGDGIEVWAQGEGSRADPYIEKNGLTLRVVPAEGIDSAGGESSETTGHGAGLLTHGEEVEGEHELGGVDKSLPSETSGRGEYVLMGVDCFGVGEGVCETFMKIAGLSRGQKLPMGWTGGTAARDIQHSGPYCFVGLSPVFYPDGSAYISIDVVGSEEGDRLRLRPAPGQTIATRSNLVDVYSHFKRRWMELFSMGIEVKSRIRGGHWDYGDEVLDPFVKLFRSQVPRHRQELVRVLLFDINPTRRQAAAGLLGFDSDDAAVSGALSMALLDPVSAVRSTAARSLLPKVRRTSPGGMALIETKTVLHMLGLPTTSDRSGASALLAELARLPSVREDILDSAYEILLQMVAATSPGSRGSAVEVLEKATGLKYGRNVSRWRKLKI